MIEVADYTEPPSVAPLFVANGLWEKPEHILVIEFDYAFATDTLGGPKFSMMFATDSVHGSFFAVMARTKGGQDDHVMQSFQNFIDRLGFQRQN